MDVHDQLPGPAHAPAPARPVLLRREPRDDPAPVQPPNQAQHRDRGRKQPEHRRPQKPRSVWIHTELTEERRRGLGHYYTLLNIDMREVAEQGLSHDQLMFRNYTRITPEVFLELLDRVGPHITKQDTNYRTALEAGLKLVITLRFLASGDSYHSLKYNFRVAHNTISNFVPEVCRAIYTEMFEDAFKRQMQADDWRAVAKKFQDRWNMPHCMGAMDGKHFRMKNPAKAGSKYRNYKGFFSVNMLALADAEYKFLWAELGGSGCMSDSQMFLLCDLREAFEEGNVERPAPCPLTDDPEDTTDIPFFMVSDDAFALKDYCLKPFSRHSMSPRERIFNYRLSRSRRVVENAFGLLANRFRLFLKPCELQPDNLRDCITAAMTLHNMLIMRRPPPPQAVDQEDRERNVIPGSWRQMVMWEQPANEHRPPRATNAGMKLRNDLADYFGTPRGMVPWQWRMANLKPPTELPEFYPQPGPADPQPAPANPQPADADTQLDPGNRPPIGLRLAAANIGPAAANPQPAAANLQPPAADSLAVCT
eukprot:TRINITY_DN55823_c0_g1_i1.p1 TRINITY_DN55823_c0_g1~~TRINITY_DN55823_c0_g1_i1.p1  ORF type:complete len:536 (+),score=138.50 TRINITY_DN55823_c0_g1_i1:400-2007(+)